MDPPRCSIESTPKGVLGSRIGVLYWTFESQDPELGILFFGSSQSSGEAALADGGPEGSPGGSSHNSMKSASMRSSSIQSFQKPLSKQYTLNRSNKDPYMI